MSNYTIELTGAEREQYIAEHFNKPQKEIKAMKDLNTSAFFYVDGIPTKGEWIDLGSITNWDDIKDQLGAHLSIDPADIDEVLCADIDGIARHFYASNCDSFDLDAWLEFKDAIESTHLEIEIIEAYIENMGAHYGVNIDDIEEAYCGEFNSWEDFAYDMAENCFSIPEEIASYFDYEKFGRDLSYDYFESNGYFFRNL